MTKTMRAFIVIQVVLFCLATAGGTVAWAATTTPAKHLEKGIALYEEGKDDEARDHLITVLMDGNNEQVAIANQYINLIHNRAGGIQSPVEVDVNFKEGEVRSLRPQTVAATQQAVQEQAVAMPQEVSQKLDEATTVLGAQPAGPETVEEDLSAVNTQAAQELAATPAPQQADMPLPAVQPAAVYVPANQEPADVTLATLTTPDAVEARDLYTQQKIASMTSAAMDQLNDTKGVHLYTRDGRPDALDIDPEILFEKNTFRTDALPTLNSIYELLALTQGAAYVILPPGSYTDDVTLSGIRQAMALNSYLINRGISQGKLHYNMGLADQEPPARFANLNGIGIVFDYDQKLPTLLENNENNEKEPLLSMAIVPLCHAIDRSLGEAFAIDFSVLETVYPIQNWVLQVVQHGRDGKYYVVRQLEGFMPVYHQILWNGRKGIIGPELPCGKYTLVLTAMDSKGNQQTLRRRVIVKCSEQTTSACTGTCRAATGELNYKAARLWKKPARTWPKAQTVAKAASEEVATDDTVASVQNTDTSYSKTTTRVTNIHEDVSATDDGTGLPAAAPATVPGTPTGTAAPDAPLTPAANPYEMPYEDDLM